MSDYKQEVSDTIRKARLAKGLTQKELGAIVGVGEPTINKYESGKQNLTVETLKKVADALNLKLKITFHK